MRQVTLTIEGMSCGHCLHAVNRALTQTPGVAIDSVEIGRATVRYDEGTVTPAAIADAVHAAGYPAHVLPGMLATE